MRVLKFGGTSVANAERFFNVADIALKTASQSETALVLSAPAKIGKEELAQIRAIVEPIITTCAEKHPNFDKDKVLDEFNVTMALIKRRIEGILLLGQCPELVMAFIESRGESFSIAIMAELLRALGKKVRVIDPVAVLVTEGGIMENMILKPLLLCQAFVVAMKVVN